MRPPLLSGTTGEASAVLGVHGAPGRTRWKCFATRRDLSSDCEAVEWASLPPGGVSGEHLHTRTEEIYLILSGEGTLMLDGRPQAVGPGSLAMTGAGAVHGLRNAGTSDLDWFVIESFTAATSAVFNGFAHHGNEVPVRRTRVVDMNDEPMVDTADVFTGPLRQAQMLCVAAGKSVRFSANGVERSLFVLSGRGTAVSGTETIPLARGVCLTLPLGARAEISAAGRLELFEAVLAVPDEETS